MRKATKTIAYKDVDLSSIAGASYADLSKDLNREKLSKACETRLKRFGNTLLTCMGIKTEYSVDVTCDDHDMHLNIYLAPFAQHGQLAADCDTLLCHSASKSEIDWAPLEITIAKPSHWSTDESEIVVWDTRDSITCNNLAEVVSAIHAYAARLEAVSELTLEARKALSGDPLPLNYIDACRLAVHPFFGLEGRGSFFERM